MNFIPEKYGALLASTLPSVINDNDEHERVLGIVEKLMSKGEESLSPEEEKLLDLLANLIEEYESRIYPILPESTPLEMLLFLMKENELKQKDLLEVFGSDGIASEVINGKRAISKTHAKKLAERFKVSADLFI